MPCLRCHTVNSTNITADPITPAIEVIGLSKHFLPGRAALQNLNLRIQPGERVALLGASGSGKSTLLRLLSGLEVGDRDAAHGSGSIRIFGSTLQAQGRLAANVRELRRDIGLVFQQFNLVGRLSVMTNVMTGLSAALPLAQVLTGRFPVNQQVRGLDALRMLGLEEQAFQRASTLSGGQQQRAAIARVLVQGARILLADEPVASLDPASTRRVMDHLRHLNESRGLTLVVSLHHIDLARRYCNRVVALRQGQLVYDGPSAELNADLLHHLYGEAAQELLTPANEATAPENSPSPFLQAQAA